MPGRGRPTASARRWPPPLPKPPILSTGRTSSPCVPRRRRSRNVSWPRNDIDRFVLARLEQRKALAVAGSVESDAAAPRHPRPHRPAADRRRARRVPRRHQARRLRAGGRSAAGVAALRRALGAPVARPGALRRHQRLREGQSPQHLEVPRLGDRRAQPRHAVRSVHDRADRRRHAAERDHRAEDRHRLPPQRDDQRGGRRRSRGVDVRGPRRSRQHDGNGLARHRRSAAPSATTTSTIRSARRTISGCSRSSPTRTTRAARSATARASSRPGSIWRRPSRSRHASSVQAEIDRLEQELKTPTPALREAQEQWEQSLRAGGGVLDAADADEQPTPPTASR